MDGVALAGRESEPVPLTQLRLGSVFDLAKPSQPSPQGEGNGRALFIPLLGERVRRLGEAKAEP